VTDYDQVATPTVRFGRLQHRGLLLGFSGARVACIALAVSVATPAIFVGGTLGMAVTGPLWVSLLALVFVPWAGKPAIETLPTAAHFGVRRVLGQLSFRTRTEAPRPSGTLALPGDAAALRFLVDDISGAAMVHDTHAGTLTAVALVRHPAYVLLSPGEQSRRVNGWGRALAGLAAQGTCARVQVLEIALPDSGRGITGWWEEHRRADAPDWTLREYQELMRTCAPAASTHRTLIALSLDTRAAGRAIRDAGHGLRGAAAVLRQDMRAFEAGLREAELQLTSWLDEGSLAATLRAAFDPAGMLALDGTSVGRRLQTAGPVAVEEHWDHLRHDSAYSAVLWVTEWPRIDVPPSFLHGLVFQQGVRKTISITATPLTTAQAMRDIRKAKVEYVTDSAQKARIGTIADQSDAQELSDVMDRERALIAGHADLRFTGLIAVTAGTKEELDSALSQVQRAATQCGCETRLLCGEQARAFAAAALPLARRVS
jgi:Putative type VII ESX secretion system translocon, EccE